MIVTQPTEKCPECGSKDISYHPERGEISCRNCGYVISDNLPYIDAYDGLVRIQYLKQGKKLRYAFPNILRSSEDRAVRRMVNDLKNLRIRLKRYQKKEVAKRYLKLYKEGWTERRNRVAVISALAFLILRREEEPILLQDFRIKGEKVMKYARQISRKTDLKLIPGNPKKFIQRFGNQLRIPDYLITSALTVYKRLEDSEIFRNRSYKSVALSCLLVTAKLQGITFSQEELKSITKVSVSNQSKLRRKIRGEVSPGKILNIAEYFR